jgi:hypothetical protein
MQATFVEVPFYGTIFFFYFLFLGRESREKDGNEREKYSHRIEIRYLDHE